MEKRIEKEEWGGGEQEKKNGFPPKGAFPIGLDPTAYSRRQCCETQKRVTAFGGLNSS